VNSCSLRAWVGIASCPYRHSKIVGPSHSSGSTRKYTNSLKPIARLEHQDWCRLEFVIDIDLSEMNLGENSAFHDNLALKLVEKRLCDVVKIGADFALWIVREPHDLCPHGGCLQFVTSPVSSRIDHRAYCLAPTAEMRVFPMLA
jgi:hypothetical protein